MSLASGKLGISHKQEKKLKKMENELYLFSTTLNSKHFEKALYLREQLKQ
jgi:hypothetical protein